MKLAALFGTVGFAALLLTSTIATVAPAQAQHREDCRDSIRHAERHLDRMIERFGHRSEAARDARHDLERIRDRCSRDHDRYDDRRRHGGWRR